MRNILSPSRQGGIRVTSPLLPSLGATRNASVQRSQIKPTVHLPPIKLQPEILEKARYKSQLKYIKNDYAEIQQLSPRQQNHYVFKIKVSKDIDHRSSKRSLQIMKSIQETLKRQESIQRQESMRQSPNSLGRIIKSNSRSPPRKLKPIRQPEMNFYLDGQDPREKYALKNAAENLKVVKKKRIRHQAQTQAYNQAQLSDSKAVDFEQSVSSSQLQLLQQPTEFSVQKSKKKRKLRKSTVYKDLLSQLNKFELQLKSYNSNQQEMNDNFSGLNDKISNLERQNEDLISRIDKPQTSIEGSVKMFECETPKKLEEVEISTPKNNMSVELKIRPIQSSDDQFRYLSSSVTAPGLEEILERNYREDERVKSPEIKQIKIDTGHKLRFPELQKQKKQSFEIIEQFTQKVHPKSKIQHDWYQMEILYEYRQNIDMGMLDQLLDLIRKKWLNKDKIQQFADFQHESKLIIQLLDQKQRKSCPKCDSFLQILLHNTLNLVIIDRIEGLEDLAGNTEFVSLCLRIPNINESFISLYMEDIFLEAKNLFKLIEKKGEEKTKELLEQIKVLRQLTYYNPDLLEESFCDFEGFLKYVVEYYSNELSQTISQSEKVIGLQILKLCLFAIIQMNDVRAFQDEKLCQLIIWKQQKKFPKLFEVLENNLEDIVAIIWKEHQQYNELLPIMAQVNDLYKNKFVQKMIIQ